MIKISRNKLRLKRKKRISAKIKADAKKPRLSIFKSLTGIKIQVIDDAKCKTLVAADSKLSKLKNNLEGAKKLGKIIAKKCLDKKIGTVIFDRSGYKFHGKIRAVAEGAREGGLKL